MYIRPPDFSVLGFIALIGIVFGLVTPVTFLPLQIIQFIVAFLLVLFVPGYVLTLILFQSSRMDWTYRLLLAVGISIGLCLCIGLGLHYTNWKLTPQSWSVTIGVVTLMLIAILMVQRRGRNEHLYVKSLRFSFTDRQSLIYAASIIILAIPLAFATSDVVPGISGMGNTPQFTRLWLHPTSVNNAFSIGIETNERSVFRLDLHYGTSLVYTNEIPFSYQITKWESDFVITDNLPASGLLEAKLYRPASPDKVAYRVFLHVRDLE